MRDDAAIFHCRWKIPSLLPFDDGRDFGCILSFILPYLFTFAIIFSPPGSYFDIIAFAQSHTAHYQHWYCNVEILSLHWALRRHIDREIHTSQTPKKLIIIFWFFANVPLETFLNSIVKPMPLAIAIQLARDTYWAWYFPLTLKWDVEPDAAPFSYAARVARAYTRVRIYDKCQTI